MGTRVKVERLSEEEQISLKQKEKLPEKRRTRATGKKDDFINIMPSTSTAQSSSMVVEEILVNDSSSQTSDSESSLPWTDSKDVKLLCSYKCHFCGISYMKCSVLKHHIVTTCLLNPNSRTNRESGKFRCLDCGRNYKEMKFLRFHQKHECQQKITCSDCGTTFIGSVVPDRHKKNYCVKKQRRTKKENSPTELYENEQFSNDSD